MAETSLVQLFAFMFSKIMDDKTFLEMLPRNSTLIQELQSTGI